MILNEQRLHNIILESINTVLSEARGIKSKKLYDIMQQYGGFDKTGFHGVYDVHNMTDDNIIGVIDHRQLQDAERTVIGQGRYRDENGLNAWAQKMGYKIVPGDGVVAMRLRDGEHYVMAIVPNLYQAVNRQGEGWDSTHNKRERRHDDNADDGKRRYIPKYRDPERFTMWKNPYKKTDWSREDIDATMDRIRSRRANKELKPRY